MLSTIPPMLETVASSSLHYSWRFVATPSESPFLVKRIS